MRVVRAEKLKDLAIKSQSKFLLNIKSLFWLLVFLCLGFFLSEIAVTSAQENNQQQSEASKSSLSPLQVSGLIQDRANKILRRYLKPNQFSVDVDVELKQQDPSKKLGVYIPREVNFALIKNKPLKEISKNFVSKLTIKLSLVELPDETKQSIQGIVERELAVDTGRGDSIELETLTIKFPEPEENTEAKELEERLEKAQSETKETEREVNRLNTELALAKKEADEAARKELEMKQEKAELAKKKEELDKKEADLAKEKQAEADQLNFYAQLGGLLVSLLVAVIVFLGIKSLASSIQTGAGSLGEALKTLKPEAPEAAEPEAVVETAAGDAASGGSGDSAESSGAQISMTLDSARQQLEVNRQALEEQLEDNEGMLLTYLNVRLVENQDVPLCVACMELFGPKIADRMFKKLNKSAQDRVIKFLKKEAYPKTKLEMMLEAANQVDKIFLSGSLLSGKVAQNEKVTEAIIGMNNEQQIKMMFGLDEDARARFLLYFESGQISRMISQAYEVSPDQIGLIADALYKIPQLDEEMGKYDEEILSAIENEMGAESGEQFREYLNLYTETLKALPVENMEDFLEKMSEKEDALRSALEERVVSTRLALKIQGEYRDEMISKLSNKQIAAFLLSLTEEQAAEFDKAIPDRRKEMISDEKTNIAEGSARKRDKDIRAAKQAVLLQLQRLQESGELAMAMEASEEEASDDVKKAS